MQQESRPPTLTPALQLGSSIFIGLLLDTEPAASLLLTCTSLRLTDLIHRVRDFRLRVLGGWAAEISGAIIKT